MRLPWRSQATVLHLDRQAASRAAIETAAAEWAKLAGASTGGPFTLTADTVNRLGVPVRVTIDLRVEPR